MFAIKNMLSVFWQSDEDPSLQEKNPKKQKSEENKAIYTTTNASTLKEKKISQVAPSITSSVKGPKISSFPINSEDYQAYFFVQHALREIAIKQGFFLTVYDKNLYKSKKVYIKEIEIEKKIEATSTRTSSRKHTREFDQKTTTDELEKAYNERQRGLFAQEKIEKGELIVPYEGKTLDHDQFEKTYPLKDKDKIVHLRKCSFKKDPSYSSDKQAIIIKDTFEMRQMDLANLTGTNLGINNYCLESYAISLDGYHEAGHTFTLVDQKKYIDSEIKASNIENQNMILVKDEIYILGFAAFANSGDPIYGKGRINNAEYWACPSADKVILIAKKQIEKDEEILSSDQCSKVFETENEMLKALKQ